jgi:hypothetical protein
VLIRGSTADANHVWQCDTVSELSLRKRRPLLKRAGPGWVGPVHHVNVVVAREPDQKSGEPRIRRDGLEKLRPFRRTAGVGHASRDQDRVERLLRMDLVQSRPDLPEPPVSSRAGPSALEALPFAYIALIRVQPVALQALGLGNPKARQKHEVNGGKRDWVLAVPLGDARRLAKLLDRGAQATLLFRRVYARPLPSLSR